jgi:predicted nuclease of predicted toxin-antitoxin system
MGARLLLDENLSPVLPKLLGDWFEAAHVRDVGLRGADDLAIWTWAGQHGYAIATKDVDFQDLATRLGPPPKVVQIRIGNCTTREIAEVFHTHGAAIREFLAGDTGAVLLLAREA